MSSRRSAFDELAGDYDRQERENLIRRKMRARSLAVLDATFPAGASLLDVGCGTGTEAIWLAERGRRVLAVDPSPKMLEMLAARADAAKVKVSTRLLPAAELATLADELGDGSLDGAYSSFGALNAEPDLEAPLTALARLIRPGGRIVLGVMNRWCVAETVLMLARGRARESIRRYKSSLTVGVGSASIEVRYPSWPELGRIVGHDFRVVRVEALLLFLLPYAWPAFAGRARLFRLVARIDDWLAPHRPWAWLGDHLVVVAERRQT